jgi:hypothetical protein
MIDRDFAEYSSIVCLVLSSSFACVSVLCARVRVRVDNTYVTKRVSKGVRVRGEKGIVLTPTFLLVHLLPLDLALSRSLFRTERTRACTHKTSGQKRRRTIGRVEGSNLFRIFGHGGYLSTFRNHHFCGFDHGYGSVAFLDLQVFDGLSSYE